MKKLLTLITALAMVLALVPGMALSAAAEVGAAYAFYTVEGLTSAAPDASYKFIGDQLGNSWTPYPWNSDRVRNSNWNGWNGAAQLYSCYDDNGTIIDCGNTDGTINANNVVKNGTKGKDYFVLTWKAESQNNALEQGISKPGKVNYSILASDGNTVVDSFSVWGSNAEGLNPNAGSASPAGFSYEDNGAAANGAAAIKTQYYMVYANNADKSGYKVFYYYKEPSAKSAVWIGTKSFSGKSIDGFGGFTLGRGEGGWSRMFNFEVYAGMYSDLKSYTVKYLCAGAPQPEKTLLVSGSDAMRLGYNKDVVLPLLDIPYFSGYVFKNKTVSGNEVTLNYEQTNPDALFFDNVRGKNPNEKFINLNMLGAHDAFTAGMTDKKDAAGTVMDDGAKAAAYSPGTALPISKAQSGDALTLLNSGVRYFDIRLSRSTVAASGRYLLFMSYEAPHTNGVFYTTHGLLGDEFAPVMFTIAQWAKEHPGEIIVLDFQECYDYNGDKGDSTADTWRDIDKILAGTGVKEFVTLDKNSDIAAQTYAGLTANGTRSNIVLFGRYVATNAGVGNFILRGDLNGAFNGKVYSNYDKTGVNITSKYNPTYIQSQVDTGHTDARFSEMYRVMQAQSGGATVNLINQAASDHEALLADLKGDKSAWLEQLPVVMVDDAAVGTEELLALLKSSNENVNITYTLDGKTIKTDTRKKNVAYDFSYRRGYTGNTLYMADPSNSRPSGDVSDVTVPLVSVKNADVNGIKKNSIIEREGKKYIVASDNLIPNGDFAFGTAGFYTGNDGNVPIKFSASDNKITNLGNTGKAGEYSFYSVFDIEKGKTYLTTIDIDTTNEKGTLDNSNNNYTLFGVYDSIKDSAGDAQGGDNNAFKLTAKTNGFTTKEAIVHNANGKYMAYSFRWIGNAGTTSYKNFGLYELAEIPTPTPALGWDGSNFTIDFLLGDKAVSGITYDVEVYRGEELAGEADVTVSDSINGIPFAPGSTNAVYTAKIEGGDSSAKVSVYSLVAEAIENGNFGEGKAMKKAQADAAAKVITAGGIYMRNGQLNEYTAKVLDPTENGVKIKDELFAAGLKFAAGTAKYETDSGEKHDITIEAGAKSIDIPNFNAQEAETFILHEIEFVFEPEGISETDTDSGEIDFVEEI